MNTLFFVLVYLKVFACSMECLNHIVTHYGIIFYVLNLKPGTTYCTILRVSNGVGARSGF